MRVDKGKNNNNNKTNKNNNKALKSKAFGKPSRARTVPQSSSKEEGIGATSIVGGTSDLIYFVPKNNIHACREGKWVLMNGPETGDQGWKKSAYSVHCTEPRLAEKSLGDAFEAPCYFLFFILFYF